MSIFQKLFTALKGGAREVGEGLIDANAIRIFEQEIVDAKNALTQAKKSLTQVMAKEMQSSRAIKAIDNKISEHENYAAHALAQDNEPLALEIAQKIAEFEQEKTHQVEVLQSFQNHIAALKQQIKKAEKIIQENQRQLSMVKTTESVQKATLAVNDTLINNNSSMASAKESLERIKQRQADRQDQINAAEILEAETNNCDLENKLHEAGIGKHASRTQAILARIKAKQS